MVHRNTGILKEIGRDNVALFITIQEYSKPLRTLLGGFWHYENCIERID